MAHKTEKFKFLDIDGKEVEFESAPYCFDLEENVLIKRFGKELIEEFAKTHILNFKIRYDHIKEDFSKLLIGDFNRVDLGKQSGDYYEELRRVYYFFLEYDSNAQLRQSELLSETIASNLKTLKTTLAGMQEITSALQKDKTITNS